jgi:dienelactone hydrolase
MRQPQTRRFFSFAILTACFCLSSLVPAAGTSAAGPRLLKGELPQDARLEPLRDLNSYFPMATPRSASAWVRRAENVRRRVLVSQGIWPMPTRSPLAADVHGRSEHDGYTIEKVSFEAMPGFHVTGSLYRPRDGQGGKRPAILCPHGHWSNGRFYDNGRDAGEDQIRQGAEKFRQTARSPLQARCIHLARMGCVVFHYDMIGYADSQQISFELAHRFATQRPQMNSATAWGLFSPQAESHLQSVMGLQTWSSIRAADFLLTLDDVDPDRLAVTGASGGGTQTFILAAVDPRIKVAMPAVMVSTAMQGGCTCENACCLRIGAGNVDVAALFAPKPLGLTAADDWTHEMETKGFPELQGLYRLIGREEDVMLAANIQFKHNYNLVSRVAMYGWMNKHLGLGHETVPEETEIDFQDAKALTVWNDDHPRPQGGEKFERELLQYWHRDAQQQLDRLVPRNRKSLARYRDVVGAAIDTLVGESLPRPAAIDYQQLHKVDKGDYLEIGGVLNIDTYGGQLPVLFLYPKQWNQQTVIWLSEQGKAGLYDDQGSPLPDVRTLLEQGTTVMGVDLLFQGEFLAEGRSIDRTRQVANTRQAAAYSFGYNPTLAARRIHDILSVISYLGNHETNPEKVSLVALDATAPLAIAARAQARDAVDQLAVRTSGFRFAAVDDIHSPLFLPGGAKYHDLPGMLAVAAPGRLWIAGEGDDIDPLVAAAYRAAGNRDAITRGDSTPAVSLTRWLLSAAN